MNAQWTEYVPQELINFLLVIIFSLLIGLSLHRLNLNKESEKFLFGTDRTFTFIGILGYLLYILDPTEFKLYIFGGTLLGLLLAINYYIKQSKYQLFGVTTIVIALITYALPPIVVTQPSWLYIMVVVAVLLFMEMKHNFAEFAQRMKNDEMVTLAKFLAISGIILPILPDENLLPDINLTPYTVWLATVVVSGISYLSYLLKRYVFRESGTLVSGIIGGLYSSTATISVLARKGKESLGAEAEECVAAMLMAVSMMFLRFMVLIGIFSKETLFTVWPYLLLMSLVAFLAGLRIHMKNCEQLAKVVTLENEPNSSNPLEFKVALIFAMLFVVFTLVTHYTFVYAGNSGLHVLSFISGLSDITPFILNLLESTSSIAIGVVAACCMQAIISNICINMCYALFFSNGNKTMKPQIFRGFGVVIATNIALLGIYYFL